ncbi:CaiB/BaiF CoA transferase family protein [Rhodopseudomonas palustris]|uniref:CaiB/BaiF CoA transferase family protein n=1 Tax=Rhodopseudomonas palustris TaxID=1076 RepID=UPI0002E515C9
MTETLTPPASGSARDRPAASGPLSGLRIVEFAGLGPGPFAAMMLADMGADVVTLSRGEQQMGLRGTVMMRGRRSITADLKDKACIAEVLKLCDGADALIEGYRPGVMERLGLGPDVVTTRNKRLVYARMTGWGQSGPLSGAAGHDINYIALTGALAAIGERDRPVPPLNLVGDYGGGALYLVVGLLAALLEAKTSGQGQVVDVAMCDGAASLMSLFCELSAAGRWKDGRESNLLDGGAHFYGTYQCKDGEFIALGAIEPQFYAELRRLAGLDDPAFDRQMSPKDWPALKAKMAELFKTKTRAEWCAIMEGTDVCFAPVLSLSEAPLHPHMAERAAFVSHDGVLQPAPAPRFSRTPSAIRAAVSDDLAGVARQWQAR